jgi:hypothetical protein
MASGVWADIVRGVIASDNGSKSRVLLGVVYSVLFASRL